MTVLAAIPNISPGRLPATYTAAKLALKNAPKLTSAKNGQTKPRLLPAMPSKLVTTIRWRTGSRRAQYGGLVNGCRKSSLAKVVDWQKLGRAPALVLDQRLQGMPASPNTSAKRPFASPMSPVRNSNPQSEATIRPRLQHWLRTAPTQYLNQLSILLAALLRNFRGIKLFGLFDHLVRGI